MRKSICLFAILLGVLFSGCDMPPEETGGQEGIKIVTVTELPEATATPELTPTEKPEATATLERRPTEKPGATVTPERRPTEKPEATATPEPTPTRKPEPTPTEKPKASATPGPTEPTATQKPAPTPGPELTLSDIPAYAGKEYVTINENKPYFTEYSTESFESYSELDNLGRCGAAFACIGRDLMPTVERGEIGSVKPSGWHTVRYDTSVIKDYFLYNRCHLIAYQLTGENANEKNLITGTRFLNMEGMKPFEDRTADYIERTGNHVMYRVTPMFEGDNLVATGVRMEGWSVEDNGEGICFHIFAYNVQPGITIDYATGESALAPAAAEEEKDYVLNTNTKKFHVPGCSSVETIKEKNKQLYTGGREEIIEKGYKPCKRCNP